MDNQIWTWPATNIVNYTEKSATCRDGLENTLKKQTSYFNFIKTSSISSILKFSLTLPQLDCLRSSFVYAISKLWSWKVKVETDCISRFPEKDSSKFQLRYFFLVSFTIKKKKILNLKAAN